MEEIAERAGVTRGPLYHYFDDKQDLFRGVYAEVERYLAEKVLLGIRSRVGPDASAWEQVHAGNHAFLDTALEPFVQRIAILDAPAVLGWDSRRDFARYGLGLIRNGLQMAMDEGSMDPQPVEPLAHLAARRAQRRRTADRPGGGPRCGARGGGGSGRPADGGAAA